MALFFLSCVTLCSQICTFSNGDLDPLAVAGVSNSTNPSVAAVIIKGGAHHLDLRHSNPADTPSVIAARKKYRTLISSWMKEQ